MVYQKSWEKKTTTTEKPKLIGEIIMYYLTHTETYISIKKKSLKQYARYKFSEPE